MRRFILPAAALAALAAPAPAAAQVADQDIRCLLAANVFARAEKDQNRRQVAVMSTFYYLGRIDGKLPPEQLKTRVIAIGKGLNNKTLGQVMSACAANLQKREQAFQAIGKQIAAQNPK